MSSFLESIAGTVVRAVEPLEDALDDAERFELLLLRHGWRAPVQANVANALKAAFGLEQVLTEGRQLLTAVQEAEDLDFETLERLGKLVAAVVEKVVTVAQAASSITASPFDKPAFWEAFPADLFNGLLVTRVAQDAPGVYALLLVTGVVRHEAYVPLATDPPERTRYERTSVDWAAIARLVRDPTGHLASTYGWGGAFRHEELLGVLARAALALGVPARPQAVSAPLRRYFPASGPPASARELVVPLLEGPPGDGGPYIQIGLLLLPVPPTADKGAAPDGLVLTALANGFAGVSIPLVGGLDLRLRGGFDATGALALEAHPGSVAATFQAPTIDAEIALVGRPPTPWVLLGDERSSRLEVGGLLLSARVSGSAASPELTIRVGTGEDPAETPIAVVVSFGEGDSFLQKLFGGEPQRFEFGGLLTWSSRTGLEFQGEAGITLTIPLNTNIGPVSLDTLTVALRVSDQGVGLMVALTGAATLGPVVATATNVGVILVLSPREPGAPPGLLGDLDLQFRFKAPDGLGIVIDAGPITGGGFLEIDQANGRYAGILQLQAAGFAITAIGLLDTRLPGGMQGYSFLIIITAKFSPIQLGFGFALTGVGGLAGINRALVTDALQAGVRSGSVDHILFPADPVKDAPRIISDLRTIFPPAAGRYVFGPMASIVWGNSIIEAELGIVLTLPSPIVIVLLGQINLALPTKKEAIVELHIDIVGVLDFGNKRLEIDASLHDSRVLAFNLYGDMALRLSWGERPDFAVSVGGLHPLFQPPPRFPQLRRLTLALGTGENPRLTLQTYLAITSNSFQIGAHAELYAEAGGFNLKGWIGFDALFYFSPFEFRADFTAGIALRRGQSVLASVQLDAHLTGPAPWHVWGEASLSILFFHITVPFDRTFGEEQRVDALPGDPWQALDEAVKDPRSWSATPPLGSTRAVSVASQDDAGGPALVDPLGGLTMRQRAVPLHRTLTKFGEGALAAPVRFDLQGITVGTQPASGYTLVREPFAPGPFEELSDSDKLTRASFEQMDAGMSIAATAVAFGGAVDIKGVDAEYETVQVDARGTPGTRLGTHVVSQQQLLSVLGGGAVARAGLTSTGDRRFAPPAGRPARVRLDDEGYLVAATADLRVRTDLLAEAAPRGAAEHALATWLQGRPTDRGALQVVPEHEVVMV